MRIQRESIAKRMKEQGFRIIISMLILTALGWICLWGNEIPDISPKFSTEILNDFEYQAYGYDIVGNEFVPNGGDAQIHLDMQEMNVDWVYGLKLYLNKPINLANVQVFYSNHENEYSEGASFRFNAENSNIISVSDVLPYRYWRIDIEQDFSIIGIEIADETEMLYHIKYEVYALWMLLVAVISVLLGYFGVLQAVALAVRHIVHYIFNLIKKFRTNRKATYLSIACVLLTFIVPAFYRISTMRAGNTVNLYSAFGYWCIAVIIAISVLSVKYINYQKLHIYFFIIVMLIGTFHIWAAPPSVGISWDDQIHYGRTEYLSRGAQGVVSLSERELNWRCYAALTNQDSYTRERRTENIKSINVPEKNNVLVNTDGYEWALQYVAYIPAAFALALLRGLGGSFLLCFMFGKFTNLLCYALMFTYAIKNIEKGKLLIGVVGLIPTSLFMASSYSYDWIVIASIALGYSIVLGDIQRNQKVSSKRFALAVTVLTMGGLVKAVYFLLLLPLVCFKKEYYESKRRCIVYTALAIMILIFSFMEPTLRGYFQGDLAGDSRGGAGVNAGQQIDFILHNIVEYIIILKNHILSYCSLDNSCNYLTYMAYYGMGKYANLCIVIITIASIVDNDIRVIWRAPHKIFSFFCVAGSVVLVSTAMYISFTEVGSMMVAGCSHRYLLPCILPFLLAISDIKIHIENSTKIKAFILGNAILAIVFLLNFQELCLKLY